MGRRNHVIIAPPMMFDLEAQLRGSFPEATRRRVLWQKVSDLCPSAKQRAIVTGSFKPWKS